MKQAVHNTSDLFYALQQRNLVYNSNFLNYSNQVINKQNNMITYNHPDGWLYSDSGSGGSVGYNVGNCCCRIQKSSGKESLMQFSQALHEFPRWKQYLLEHTVSAVAVVSTPSGTSNTITIRLSDGITESSRSVLLVPNVKQRIPLNLHVDWNATGLILSLESSSPAAIFDIYEVYANVGKVALPNLMPTVQGFIGERKQYVSTETPPATELSICASPIELSEYQSRLDSVLNGAFGVGPNNRSLLPDMRGYFSRAWNNGATTDPDASSRTSLGGNITGDNVGTVEQDAFRHHSHQLKFSVNTMITTGTGPSVNGVDPSHYDSTNETGGSETRSKNISELYTIKWA